MNSHLNYLTRQLQYPTPAIGLPAMRDGEQNVSSAAVNNAEGCEDGAEAYSIKRQQSNVIQPTPGALPDSANQLSKPARALLMRLLEKDHKVRLRNLRQLQQSAFYLGFNFEHAKTKKVSPKSVLENHRANMSAADLLSNANKNKTQEFLEFDQEVVL